MLPCQFGNGFLVTRIIIKEINKKTTMHEIIPATAATATVQKPSSQAA